MSWIVDSGTLVGGGMLLGVATVAAFLLVARRGKLAGREAATHAKNVWFRTTLASIGDAVIATDEQGNVTFLNAAAQAMTGWGADEARGQPLEAVFRIIDECTRAPAANPARRALAEGVIAGLANRTLLIARDGAECPIDDSAAPIRDEGRRAMGVVLVFRDATENRKAARLAREREERFRALVAATAQVVWTANPQGEVEEDSPSWRDFTGQTVDESKGQGWLRAIHPDDRDRVAGGWRQAVAEKDDFDIEYRLQAKAGGYRWTAVRAVPVLEPDGSCREWVGMNTDITERREADEALRASEGQFHTLADSIPHLAWTAHTDGHIFWYNRRWYQYTGTTPEEMEGWGWQSVHDPEELPKVLDRWRGSIATGEAFDMVFPLKGRDGDFHPFLTRVVPVKDDEGRVVQWFGTNTDITEQQALEEALKDADRRKDEFLATLAHELRNPLAPIRNGLQVMRMAKGDGQTVEEIGRMMERQVAQMVRLIDDLLDISRINRGKIELRKERVDLASVVRSAVETSRPLLEQSGHAFAVAMPPEPVWLDADAIRLIQVLANLLDNAAKYTPSGGNVRLLAETAPGEVVVMVVDDGVGIPEAMLSRVFDLFAQVECSLERSQGGLGIGLTLVKRVVEMHGGSVVARSEGRGSAFVVRLPTVAAPRPETDATRDDAATPRVQRRILVVDDNEDSANSLSLLLEVMGNEVRTAYDGLAAVEAAEAFHPDVILLDIGMPGLNGFDVCCRIRERPWAKGVFIIAQTGWGQEEDRRRSREAGFDRHLVKPLDPAALERLLASAKEETHPRPPRAVPP